MRLHCLLIDERYFPSCHNRNRQPGAIVPLSLSTIAMFFPSTPERAQRLESFFSPRTANMVVSRHVRTAPPPELLEQFVEEPPGALEWHRNVTIAKMAQDKAAHEHANECAYARGADEIAAQVEKEKIDREYRRERAQLEEQHR